MLRHKKHLLSFMIIYIAMLWFRIIFKTQTQTINNQKRKRKIFYYWKIFSLSSNLCTCNWECWESSNLWQESCFQLFQLFQLSLLMDTKNTSMNHLSWRLTTYTKRYLVLGFLAKLSARQWAIEHQDYIHLHYKLRTWYQSHRSLGFW